jgi:hypothetical protein
MDIRRAKQVIYGSFYLIVVLGVIAIVWFSFLKPPPSCFDNVQNQGEQGVDCGGPCALACIPKDVQKLATVGDVLLFPSTPGHYTLLVQIANRNAGFAAPFVDYRFDLYDAAGTLLGSVPGTSYIYGGEVKYLLAPNVAVPAEAASARLVMQDPTWVPSEAMGVVPNFNNPLSVTGSDVSTSTITAHGHIVNGDVAAFTNIFIIAIFRGAADDAPLGASQTVVDRLAPNEAQGFSVMYPSDARIDPSRTQFYAYALR